MLDAYHIVRSQTAQWRVFYASQATTTTDSWQYYVKPRGASMIFMFMQAAGGSGGGGVSGAGTTGFNPIVRGGKYQ